MNIIDFENQDLVAFLNFFSVENYRQLFKGYKKHVKGFRLENTSKEQFVTETICIIKKEKNKMIAEDLENNYKKYVNELYKQIDDLVRAGYRKEIAFAKIVRSCFTNECRPLFFKLEGIGQNEISDYEKNVLILDMVDKESEDYFLKFKKEFENRIQALESDNKLLHLNYEKETKANAELDNKVHLLEELLKKTTEIINSTERSFDSQLKDDAKKIKLLEKRVTELERSFKQYQIKTGNVISDELNNEIKDIKNKISSLSKTDDYHISQRNILNTQYTLCDDYFDDNIGDVIENQTGINYDAFREYLIEVIYSNKPIIVSSKNSTPLAKIISSIITGGNYTQYNLEEDTTDAALIEAMKKAPDFEGNKVFLIRNKMNVSEHRFLFDFIKSRPFSEKYIFEILYENELMFFPKEIIHEANFFLGNLTNQNIDDSFVFQFSSHESKLHSNDDYNYLLKEFNLFTSFDVVANDKIYGLLSYSVIPFLSIHESIEKGNIISKIIKPEIRKKCEAALNEQSN